MARIIAGLAGVLGIGLLVGLVLTGLGRARAEQESRRSQEHLRRLGLALLTTALPGEALPTKPKSELPAATVFAPFPPEQRMSWVVPCLGALDATIVTKLGGPAKFDANVPWDAPLRHDLVRYPLSVMNCPAVAVGPNTSYVALAGLGTDTAARTREQAGTNAGAFRYDSPTPLSWILEGDGVSHTATLAESSDTPGPWLQGGRSTTRSLAPEQTPYLGVGRPFGGYFRGKMHLSLADGAVRTVTEQIDPAVFRSFLTIAGNEPATLDAE